MAYVRTLLISTSDVKKNTVIENNLEDHVILPNIINAHSVGLFEVLGKDFYDHLLTAVRNNTATADENNLIDTYILPYLIQDSLYRCLPYLWSKMENSSIILKETETHRSLDLEQLKYLRGDIQKDVNFLKQRLIDFLCLNNTLFPLYCSPVKSSYSTGTGFFLGDDTPSIGISTSSPAVSQNISSIIAGIGLTGGGNTGNITLDVVVDNTTIQVIGGALTAIGGGGTASTTLPLTNVSGSTLINSTQYTINMTGNTASTMTLPTAVGATGKIYVIKNSNHSSNDTVIVATTGGETIDNNATITINYPGSITVQSDGTNWIII